MSARADAHAHLFAQGYAGRLRSAGEPDGELAAYGRLRRHFGIEAALVVGYEGEPRYLGNNAYILTLARSQRWITPLPYLTLAPPPSLEALRALRAQGAAGYALYLPDQDALDALLAWPAAALAELRQQAGIVSLNLRVPGARRLDELLTALEGCALLVSHLGLPGRFARAPSPGAARETLAPLLALAAHHELHVKFSGLYAISDPGHDFPHAAAAPFVEAVLERFGPQRLLWGSDFSPLLDSVSFAQGADERLLARCSAAERAAVMGGNLLRLLARQPTKE
jgi:L-fuconolactonase